MINYLDVFYDRKTDKTYYADVVTPEVSILRPIFISSLTNPLSRNNGCMVSRRQSSLSDCKMVCTDLDKLIPVNDLGEPDHSLAPYIKIGVLQGKVCKSFFENRTWMEYAQNLSSKFREEQSKKENQEQNSFDKEVSERKAPEYQSSTKIITEKVNIPLFKNGMSKASPTATNPNAKSSNGKAKTNKQAKKPNIKKRKPANSYKLGPTGPTQKVTNKIRK